MLTDFVKKIAYLFRTRIGLREDTYSSDFWQDLILSRMKDRGINDWSEYYEKLIGDDVEFNALTLLVVVPETWFFRESASLEYVADQIVKNKKGRVLTIPCSSGEEPYSLAMLLLERGASPKDFLIDAIDVSEKAIELARDGLYTSNSFRNKNQVAKDCFFYQKGHLFALKNEVKRVVDFYVGNVLDSQFMDKFKNYDFIFCRNLFIYLTPEAQKMTLKKLESLLLDDGIIFVGATESELMRHNGWKLTGLPKFCSFKKPGLKKEDLLQGPENHQITLKAFPRSSGRIIGEATPLQEAVRLADLGFYHEAVDACKKYIEHEGKTNPEAYFLMGAIEHACERTLAAEESFIKAVYLKPNHLEALTYLALLADKKGDVKNASIYRQRISRIGGPLSG